jgi:septal ring factor EnvC (AmiA/AmiB activator)
LELTMMGLSILPSPTTLDNAVALVNAMLDPARAKEILQQLSDQTTSLNRLRDEIVEMQKKVDADRVAADAALADAQRLKAEADATYAALEGDRQRLAAWEEQKRQMAAELAEIPPFNS